MKKILMKGVSLLTVLASMFASNLALAVDGNPPVLIDEVCETQTYVSGEGDGEVPVSFIHDLWDADIPGATWVWSEDPLSDTESEIVETFTLNFNIDGAPADSNLLIASDNSYKVTVNGDLLFVDISEDNHSSADAHIIPAGNLLTGANTVEFEVTNWAQVEGTQESNPAGLLYKLTVNCASDGEPNDTPDDEECPIIYARVKFSKISNGAAINGWKNWGPGADMMPQTFVGGSTNAQLYADEAWFPLTNPDGSYITDADIATYRDVPGVAVQRLEGKIRLALYGYHNIDTGENGGKELAAGVIQLSPEAIWTPGLISPLDWSNANSNPRTHDPLINDAANPMDGRDGFAGTIDQYDHRFDRMKTWTPDRVAFHLVANTGSDAFYASYDAPECSTDGGDPCEGDCNPPCDGDCNPPIEIPGCMDDSALNYDNEATVDDGSCEYLPPDDFGGGGGSSSTSGSKSSGGGGGGEVLGATTMCTWDVNTYMRRGYKNDPTQVLILQRDLLNGYMNAGVAEDGVYGPATEAAVKAFQKAKEDRVLRPWYNLFQPTGIFYQTTLIEAKNTICPEEILPIPTNLINWSKNPGEVPAKQ